MPDETKVQAEAAAAAPAKVAEAVAATATKVVKETAVVAKRERAKSARRAKQAQAENRPEDRGAPHQGDPPQSSYRTAQARRCGPGKD